MVLSKREKILILALGGLIVIALVYFSVSKLTGYRQELTRETTRKQFQVNRARVLDAELNKLARRSPSRGRKVPLIGKIEGLAQRAEVKGRLQLNRVQLDKSKGVEGVDIKLDQLTLDELVQFLFLIENSKPALLIDSLEVTSSFRAKDQLRLSVRVLAQI